MITILHLYPRELGINGDVGNVMALAKRAQLRGLEVRILDHEVGKPLPKSVDLIHIGSGPASGQALVKDDVALIAHGLREWADAGVPFLAIAGGWQLLGRTLTALDGSRTAGVGIFPTDTVLTTNRIVDEVYGPSALGDVAGFENHGSRFTMDEPDSTIAHTRGVVYGSRVATNLHGPFLPMNPVWADWLLERAATSAGVELGGADERLALLDDFAERSRAAVKSRLGV